MGLFQQSAGNGPLHKQIAANKSLKPRGEFLRGFYFSPPVLRQYEPNFTLRPNAPSDNLNKLSIKTQLILFVTLFTMYV
jgi:hypothetical protein